MTDRTTVEVDGKPWAINLLWEDAPEEGKAKAAARTAVKEDDRSDLYVLHPSGDQYGLGVKADGHAKGMPSLAATLATVREDNWIGLFDVDGGHYLISVREDRIGAGTDMFFEDREEGVEQLIDAAAKQSWDAILSDDDSVYENAQREDLESLLVGAKPVKLAVPGAPVVPMALGALVLAAGVGGYMWWDHGNKIHLAELERLRLVQLQAAKTPPPVRIPDMPYVGEPMARATLVACSDALLRVPVTVPGFETQAAQCGTQGTVTALLSRPGLTVGVGQSGGSLAASGGTVADLRWAVGADDPDVTVRRIDENRFNVGYSADPLADVAEETELVPLGKVEEYLRSHFEILGIVTKHKDAPNLTVTRQKPDGESEQVVYGKVREVSFESPYDPAAFVDVLGKVPGLIVKTVEWNPTARTYAIQGEYHEDVPVPGAV